ncbi:hypothetical protein [Salmonella phage PKM.Hi.22.6]|nr:hypothetical protein [Salmonella phage PKM.Hi.22.6]
MRILIDTKTCKICNVEKSLEEFVLNGECKNGRSNQCKSCAAERSALWHQNNKVRRQIDARERKRASKLKAMEYMGNKCADCDGIFHPAIYQFHHLDMTTKDKNPSALFGMKWERLQAELDKCVMLCANCHMLRHYGGEE